MCVDYAMDLRSIIRQICVYTLLMQSNIYIFIYIYEINLNNNWNIQTKNK